MICVHLSDCILDPNPEDYISSDIEYMQQIKKKNPVELHSNQSDLEEEEDEESGAEQDPVFFSVKEDSLCIWGEPNRLNIYFYYDKIEQGELNSRLGERTEIECVGLLPQCFQPLSYDLNERYQNSEEVLDQNKKSKYHNYVAIGSFNPMDGIQLWNIDTLHPFRPSKVFGGRKGLRANYIQANREEEEKKLDEEELVADSHTDIVLSLTWNSTQSGVLISSSKDKTIKIWDIEKENCEETLEIHPSEVHSVEYYPLNTQYLLSDFVAVSDLAHHNHLLIRFDKPKAEGKPKRKKPPLEPQWNNAAIVSASWMLREITENSREYVMMITFENRKVIILEFDFGLFEKLEREGDKNVNEEMNVGELLKVSNSQIFGAEYVYKKRKDKLLTTAVSSTQPGLFAVSTFSNKLSVWQVDFENKKFIEFSKPPGKLPGAAVSLSFGMHNHPFLLSIGCTKAEQPILWATNETR